MKLTRSRFLDIAFVVLFISYPIVSEIIYQRRISPGESKHFPEFIGRIDEDRPVSIFDAEEGTLYHFQGKLPGPFLLAVPSSAPWYYFEESGSFVGWASDPGDMKIPDRFKTIGKGEVVSFEEAVTRLGGPP
jgi:hypothetical protein